MPGLARVTGEWRATSKVESRPSDLYVACAAARDGLVSLGDAFQGPCPATGTGVTKVLTDVACLCNPHIGSWLATSGMRAEEYHVVPTGTP